MNEIDIKQKTAAATKWATIAEIVSKLFSPIINIILARILTPEDFGVVATVNMIVGFADMFTDAGFQKYIMQHSFADRDDLNKQTTVAFWTNLVISCVLWGLILIFSNPLARLVGNDGLGNVVVISALSLPLTSFSSIHMARFKRDFDFKGLLSIRIVASLVPLVVTVPLAILLKSYWAMIIGTLAGNAINAILLSKKSQWSPSLFYSFTMLKGMFGYSWWILLESLSLWLTSYIGTFIVGLKLSQYYVGLYKTSITTVNQLMNLIIAATSTPLFVALAKLKNNKTGLKKTYIEYTTAIATFVIPIGFGIFAYRNVVVSILLGEQWKEATSFIGLWGLIYALSVVWGTYCNGLYNAVGKTYLSFLSQVLQLIVLIPVLIWSVNISFECLYKSRCIIRLELILVQFIIMFVQFGFSLWEQIKIALPSIISGSVILIIGYISHLSDIDIFGEIISICFCIIAYFSVYYFLFKNELILSLEVLGIKKERKLRQ